MYLVSFPTFNGFDLYLLLVVWIILSDVIINLDFRSIRLPTHTYMTIRQWRRLSCLASISSVGPGQPPALVWPAGRPIIGWQAGVPQDGTGGGSVIALSKYLVGGMVIVMLNEAIRHHMACLLKWGPWWHLASVQVSAEIQSNKQHTSHRWKENEIKYACYSAAAWF